jgi:4-diphosphocytidyl-2C-methyl-D-erythritol kinase
MVSHGLSVTEELRALSNDLEVVSRAMLPDIAVVCNWLKGLSPIVTMMSGSGSSSFALFDECPVENYGGVDPGWFLCATKVMRGHYGHNRN